MESSLDEQTSFSYLNQKEILIFLDEQIYPTQRYDYCFPFVFSLSLEKEKREKKKKKKKKVKASPAIAMLIMGKI